MFDSNSNHETEARNSLPVLVPPEGTQYVCPGATQPISRSVHFARLAAFDPKCRDCALRRDTGQLPRSTVRSLASAAKRLPRTSLVGEDGLRGVHLNEITRPRAERIAERFAAFVWERSPRTLVSAADRLRDAYENARARGARSPRPRVVVGRDDRPSSPEIASGVVAALRRFGCEVVDVHTVARPVLWYAVSHLEATAGVHVTGSGTPASWTGLDFVDRDGVPIVDPELLDRFDDERRIPARPSRGGGSLRSFRALVPYEAGLWRHFHALRPLRLVIGSGSTLIRGTLEQLFARLPCRPVLLDLPRRPRDLRREDDRDVERIAQEVRQRRADVGFLVDEDGQRAALVDERGTLVAMPQLRRLVAQEIRGDDPAAAVISDTLTSPIEMLDQLHRTDARFGTTRDGRCWFGSPTPSSDAILLLAHVLSALSRDDALCSRRIDELCAAA